MIGELDGCPIFTSETCALDIIGARYVREVENGEVVVYRRGRRRSSHKPFPPHAGAALHLRIHLFRAPGFHRRRPQRLRDPQERRAPSWRAEAPAEADVVVPVPDSGVPAAIGYSQASGIPFELGIIRNHYVGRTFIQPTQSIRELGVRMKHNANRAVVAGKRIVLIDDFAGARHHLGQDRAA